MRFRVVLAISLVLVAVAAIAIYRLLPLNPKLPVIKVTGCEARTATGVVALSADQMANAATIAAVGIRRNLPDRAIVVALATSLQESKLRNLSGGDRDSVGLFQQRPSQGWGTAAQIADPRYAAGRFYSALVRVKNWQEMRVTEAAQRVQKSAYPEAYEKWSDESGILAEALNGMASRAIVCTNPGAPTQRGVAAAEALTAGLRLDWGDAVTVTATGVTGLVLNAEQQQIGWRLAHWLVAHSEERAVERVRYGDQEWTASSGAWSPVQLDNADASVRVVAQVYAG